MALSLFLSPVPVSPTALLSLPETQPDARPGEVKVLRRQPSSCSEPRPRRAASSARLCPSLLQLGRLAQLLWPRRMPLGIANRGRGGEPRHLDSKTGARLYGWHTQGPGVSVGSLSPPFHHGPRHPAVLTRQSLCVLRHHAGSPLELPLPTDTARAETLSARGTH